MTRYRNSRRAFSMVELLTVIAIIGILSAVAIPQFLKARTKAVFDAGKVNMESLRSSLELYKQLQSTNRIYDFDNSCDADVIASIQGGTCNLDWLPPDEDTFKYKIDRAGGTATYTIIAEGLPGGRADGQTMTLDRAGLITSPY